MKEMKKILSLLLCVAMLLGMLPLGALATETTGTNPTETTAVTQPAGSEATAPETSAPETTAPETSAPETTVPETTVPETTVAETTVPETTVPETTVPETTVPETTVPETTVPETTVPETTAPGADETTPEDGIALAAEEDDGTIYVLAGSDFQPTDNSTATGVTLLNAILEKLPSSYAFDSFLFAGDYNYAYDETNCIAGREALDGAVTGKYTTITHEVYVQGNHDPDNLTGTSASGNNDPASGEYGVFVINEKDYMWYNDNKATIQTTASNLDAYLDAKLAANYSEPIFVVSHLPLHYCLRTQVGGEDGKYAKYIFDVLQEAGEAGLNIIFLYGHNHSHGWDDPYGGAAVYLQPGDNINIAKEGSTTEYTAEELNFTYMNAGFVSYYRDVNASYGAYTGLTMTVFIIKDGQVEVERYSADGQVNLKAAGVLNYSHHTDGGSATCCTNRGTETYAADTSVVWEDTISLTTSGANASEENTPVADSNNTGITVTAPGITNVTVTVTEKTDAAYSHYASYDITVEGYQQGETATVTVPVPAAFDAAKPVTVWDGAAGGTELGTYDIADGQVTFTTTHFSTYELTQASEEDTAADNSLIYILAGSDYHSNDTSLSSILSAVESYHSGIEIDRLLFAGDYATNTSLDASTTAGGIDSLLSAFTSDGTDEEGNATTITTPHTLVQGEHDYADSRISATGGYHFDGYGVYVINEDAYPVGGGSNTTVLALANKLYDYLHTRMDKYPNEPVFIVSYIPLLYSDRVDDDGSGYYAHHLFEMINNAGHAGLNIFFLYGHNHDALEYDAYLGGEAVYLPRHTVVPVPNKADEDGYIAHTLQFTYLNAGYVGTYGDDSQTSDRTMTLFTVKPATDTEECQVTIERFNEDGLYQLKSASTMYSGEAQVDNQLSNTQGVDVMGQIASPQEAEITAVSFHNVEIYSTDNGTTEDTTDDLTIKVISAHSAAELAPEGETNAVVTPITEEAKIAQFQDELSYTGYYALNVSVNELIQESNGFFGTVMIAYPVAWPASNLVIYKIITNADGTYSYETIAHKVTGLSTTTKDEDGNETTTVTPIVAIRAFEGGDYVIACTQSQSNTAPVQYDRVDDVTSISSGVYLMILDASKQQPTDTMVLPSVTGTGLTTESHPNITQYQKLGVTQYASAYEWELIYVSNAEVRSYYLARTNSSGAKEYLTISGGTVEFVTDINSADAFQFESVETNTSLVQPDNADDYAYRVFTVKNVTDEDGNITSSTTYYLSYNIDGNIVVSTTNDDTTQSRFVFMQRTVFNESLGTVVANPTIGSLKDVSGLANTLYTYNRITSTVTSGKNYLIAAPDYAYIMTGYTGSLAATYIEAGNANTIQLAGTAPEWTFTSSGSGYTISTEGQDGNTYYLQLVASGRPTTYSIGLTTTASNATTWTVSFSNSAFTISYTPNRTTYYLTYDASSHTFSSSSSSSSSSMYLYGDRIDPTATSNLYALADAGNDTTVKYAVEGIYPVSATTTAEEALALVQADVNVITYTSANLDGRTVLEDSDSILRWVWVDEFQQGVPGSYTLSITYGPEESPISLGTVEVVVMPGEGSFSDPQEVQMTYLDDEGNSTTGTYYLKLNGQKTFEISTNTYTVAGLQAYIQANVDVLRATEENGTYVIVSDATADWKWDMTWNDTNVDPDTGLIKTVGTYTATVSYSYTTTTDGVTTTVTKTLGTIVVNVSEKTVNTYSFSSYTGFVREDSSDDTIVVDSSGEQIMLTIKYTDGTENQVPVTVGMLKHGVNIEDSSITEGDSVSTAQPATYMNLDVFFNGAQVNVEYFNLTVLARVVPNYPEYPDEGAVQVNKTASGIDFQSTGIAQVELSATGVPIKRGADVIVMMDTSSSMNSNSVTDAESNTMTRLAALEKALENMIATFQTPGDDGELLDIRVAIADFNQYAASNTDSPYYLAPQDELGGSDNYYSNHDVTNARVYTGNGTLTADAFVDASDLAASYELVYKSGTNYDYAFDAVYQLGTAIREERKAENNGVYDRDLFVIFLSDGAPFQWNYISSRSQYSEWNNWLMGNYSSLEAVENVLDDEADAHAYYYDLSDPDGDGRINEHRMANAIKGDVGKTYEVIRKNTDGLADYNDPDGSGYIAISQKADYENLYEVPGLGATMFSIAFGIAADQQITVATQLDVINSIASDTVGATSYSYNVQSATELDEAFQTIAGQISYAATSARFLDQMGDAFSLQLKTVTYTKDNETKTIPPTIEILSYEIWTMAEYRAGTNDITLNQVGTRKSNTPKVLEVVMFSEDGTKAYSNLIDVNGDGTYGVTVQSDGSYKITDNADNIMSTSADGLHTGIIYAMTFIYNTNTTAVDVDGVNIPTVINADGTTSGSSSMLPAETFYWKMDTITTSELALRYYVYLSGSMEGSRDAGTYATNNYAILYYDNYLENHALLYTDSPRMAWQSAAVSYGFYLVNANGVPVVNQSTGMTGSFANAVKLTGSVLYQEVLLNSIKDVAALEVAAADDDVLPSYYTLYDKGASYTVSIKSDGSGSWEITQGEGISNATTYVTGHSTSEYANNSLSQSSESYDYSNTTVWFAVVWTMQSYPDTVVVDYGLPVSINVLANDMFGELGAITGVGPYDPEDEDDIDSVANENYSDTYSGQYGIAKVDENTGMIIYTPNSMKMDRAEVFGYQVNYTGTDVNAKGYYTSSVTVIPATTIYYEDSFLTADAFQTWQAQEDGSYKQVTSNWTQIGKTQDATQSEDRPGKFSLSTVDANNVYGYDSTYSDFTQYSLGSAMKTTVQAGTYSTASFTFTGTGFDVISMTSNDTGSIMVTVTNTETGKVTRKIVDTYYGYTYSQAYVTYEYTTENGWTKISSVPVEDGHQSGSMPDNPEEYETYSVIEDVWAATPDTENALYQVPVLKVDGLTYGTYQVEIRAAYNTIFDHGQNTAGEGTYDFYLDAIRIYDPANNGANDEVIQDSYVLDGEGWPEYHELRNVLINKGAFDINGNADGVVYIDGKGANVSMSDYTSYGPNNEVYLKSGNAIAFSMEEYLAHYVDANGESIVADVQIGVKSADGKEVIASICNVSVETSTDENGTTTTATLVNQASRTVSTSTDMYYSAYNQCTNGNVIVLQNAGTGIMSITNIKITFKVDPSTLATDSATPAVFSISEEDAGFAVMALCLMMDEDYEDSDPTEEPTDPTEAPTEATEATTEATEATTEATEATTEATEATTEATEATTEATEATTEATEATTEATEATTEATEATTEATEATTEATEATEATIGTTTQKPSGSGTQTSDKPTQTAPTETEPEETETPVAESTAPETVMPEVTETAAAEDTQPDTGDSGETEETESETFVQKIVNFFTGLFTILKQFFTMLF